MNVKNPVKKGENQMRTCKTETKNVGGVRLSSFLKKTETRKGEKVGEIGTADGVERRSMRQKRIHFQRKADKRRKQTGLRG